MVQFVCNITSASCFIVIRVRNQTESRLVIYVNNTLCPGKHRKNKLGTLSHMAHTSPHIVSTISSSGRSGENKITIIGMVRRLPKPWYILIVLLMSLSYTTPPLKVDIYVTLINLKYLCETLS